MSITITDLEMKILVAFVEFGAEMNGAECAEDLCSDNMTWANADDLWHRYPEMNKQQIGGVMASLESKGLIHNWGESLDGAAIPDWFADEAGIRLAWATAYPELSSE